MCEGVGCFIFQTFCLLQQPAQYDVVSGRVSGGQCISACQCWKYETVRALNGNIRMNGVSFSPALGLNGDGRSFTEDLNLTASLMVTSSASGTPWHRKRHRNEIKRILNSCGGETPTDSYFITSLLIKC